MMADYPILIFDDLVYEDFAERDNTEDPTDHYSVSPLEEATEHQVAQIVIPGYYDSGNHDTGYVAGFIQHTNITVHPDGEVGIGWQDVTPIEPQIGFRFDTNLTGNPLTIGLHLFISLSEHYTRSEQFKEFLDVGHHNKSDLYMSSNLYMYM